MGLILESTAFSNNETIPRDFCCDGKNISPPLHWKNVPQNTKSFVLIVDDPDAPNGMWVHWIVYDIKAEITEFCQDVENQKILKHQMKIGRTDFKHNYYGGPCPPSGTHRYFFKLYALDCVLNLPGGKTKTEIETAMDSHIIEMSEIIGLYSKQ
jgi:Raf kinase inhibitor-like YbhB/YbcL family protein